MAEVLLFAYGTLQDPKVQRSLFGRLLTGTPDCLSGFARGELAITDADEIAESGLTHYPVLRPAEGSTDAHPGTVFRLTEDELAAADAYEAEDYRRVLVTLTSGLEAWVYIAA